MESELATYFPTKTVLIVGMDVGHYVDTSIRILKWSVFDLLSEFTTRQEKFFIWKNVFLMFIE